MLAATPAAADEALDYARCAGVMDAVFAADRAAGDGEYLDDFADQAHIFMVLARHAPGRPSAAVLHEARRAGFEAVSREGASDDDIHVEVQSCSDLHQQLIREGRFTETPASR